MESKRQFKNELSIKGNKIKIIDIFEYVLSQPEKYIQSEISKKVKISTLDILLQYFEETEEYLKCNELLKIKNEILVA